MTVPCFEQQLSGTRGTVSHRSWSPLHDIERSLARSLRVCLLGMLLVLPGPALAVEIIAHRGASAEAPENTLAAVNLAWEQGADAVEIDVYLSRDGQIVLMHDKTPRRYGGPDRPVSDMTWEELRQLDVGAWKEERFRGEKVPLLAEVLRTIPPGKRLFIEVKTGPEIVPELQRVLTQARRPPEETVIISFSESVIAAAVRELPQLQCYWIASIRKEKDQPPVSVEQLIATARKIRAQGIDVGGETRLIDAPFVESLLRAQLPCYVWTVNEPEEAKRLAALGIAGITTDKPALLREQGLAEDWSMSAR